MSKCYFCGEEIQVPSSEVTLLPVWRPGKVMITHDEYKERTYGLYYPENPFTHKSCFKREKERTLIRWREEETKKTIEEGCWICGSKDLYNPHGGVPFKFCCKCGREKGYYKE